MMLSRGPFTTFHPPLPFVQLTILRQLVELQLCHSQEIKAIIDRAWGVVHNKHKKTETPSLPPPPGDPNSQERLQLIPLGQDKERKRYWIVDGKFENVPSIFLHLQAFAVHAAAGSYRTAGTLRLLKLTRAFGSTLLTKPSLRQILQGSTCQQTRGRLPPLSRLWPQQETNTWPFWIR